MINRSHVSWGRKIEQKTPKEIIEINNILNLGDKFVSCFFWFPVICSTLSLGLTQHNDKALGMSVTLNNLPDLILGRNIP